ncbi:MAG: hypothetical protein LBC59_01570 [Chitinispirillales bacterium]|jgi:hypothetical protein|nr:hypothetical protein [Chitinispirillales bacterium]
MLTETEDVEVGLDVPDSDSEYPPELVDQWLRNAEITKLKLATGEIKPQSVREVAAEYGVILD